MESNHDIYMPNKEETQYFLIQVTKVGSLNILNKNIYQNK